MSLKELEFPLFIISILANLSLVVVVLRFAPKTQSRMLFSLFGLSQTIWIIVNYFAIRSGAEQILSMARWTIASAVPHPLLFFLFIYSFLRKEALLRRAHAVLAGALILIFVFVALSPTLFTHLEVRDSQPTPIPGPGMALFGLYAFIFIILAFVRIFRSWKGARDIERAQWQFIGIGLLITFLLVLTFNFLLAVLSDELRYINFGHIYTLPFVLFTAYAMIRHRLLNLKAVVAELAVILINLTIFVQLVNSQTLAQFIVNLFTLAGALIVGALLIRGVIQEIKQREQLQFLTVQLEKANIKLEVLDKARAEFITMASHQLRTPPATIKWYLAAILAGDFGPISQDVRKALEKTKITNNDLITLIDDMLNVSRVERGKLEFAFQMTDPLAVTQSIVDELVPQATAKGLKLIFKRPSASIPKIMADKEKLGQVVNNLIDNAIKYTKQGRITVSVSKTTADILIRVEDTGRGLRSEETKQIFEKFGRGKDSKQYPAGLGLGLYLAKIITSQHKGRITAESKGLDKGSIFSVILPINNGLKATPIIFDLTKVAKV